MDLNEEINKIWTELIKEAKNFGLNENFFESNVKKLKVDFFCKNTIYSKASSLFVANVLNDNVDKFNMEINKISNKDLQVKFVIDSELEELKKSFSKNLEEKQLSDFNSTLKKNMVFSNFIVGDSNKDAYNASKWVSEKNFKNMNPLFLYGNTGLGKTHLANAIGNEYYKNYPNSKIKYTSSDDLIRSISFEISKNDIEKLKNEIQNLDVLIVDDIQFFAGKNKINEIFFNIFNKMIDQNKLIIMTSDKSPEELDSTWFDSRMKSRFSSGVTVKILKPDPETMKKIIISKLEEFNYSFKMSDSAITKIVNTFSTDVRKIEGIINKIFFFAITKYNEISVLDDKEIDDILKHNYEVINSELNNDPNNIVERICRNYNVSKESVLSESRKSDLTTVRKICMYVLKNKLNMTLSKIGRFFQRDHSTVITSIKDVEKMIEKDSHLKQFIESIILSV